MTTAASSNRNSSQPRRSRLAIFASVKLTVTLLVLIAATVLVGAWCPQESQVGIQKVIEMFGEEKAHTLSHLGVTDIFHSPWFLILIALLTVNMVACSMQRVFPKVRSLKQPLPPLQLDAIAKLPFSGTARVAVPVAAALDVVERKLTKMRYRVRRRGDHLTAEFGKFGRLAPTITHIGLLLLLAGVTVTSWTGFSGFQPVPVGGDLSFADSEHSKLWVGRLPEWRVRVDDSWREDYESGDPKQWYSELTVIDREGKPVKTQEISVNNPLSYGGVDIYQSSWALEQLIVRFNNHTRRFPLRQMGKVYAAFLPLDEGTILIFSVRDQKQPLRIFGKTDKWEGPRLLAQVPQGKSVKLGTVELRYESLVPVTGLQYKCDPGLPITYLAFAFITMGVMLAAVPHRQVWVHASGDEHAVNMAAAPPPAGGNGCILYLGGRSPKARSAFEKGMRKLLGSLEAEFPPVVTPSEMVTEVV